MKNIEVGSIKHLILQIIITIVLALILYPTFDWLYYKFITNSQFVYTVGEYIVEPIVFGIVAGTIIWSVEKIQLKNKGSK